MKKLMAMIAAACACALVVLAITGCAAPAKSSSSESFASTSDVSAPVQKHTGTDPVYILVVGNDNRYQTSEEEGAKKDDRTYSDTMMLMRVDPGLNSIAICTIPRDTLVQYQGQEYKLNEVHYIGYSKDLCAEVGKLFGVEVPYYFEMTFKEFADFVNKLGGVNAIVPKDMTGGDIIEGKDITLSAGEQKLDGLSALMLVRQRKLYDGDGEACRQLITRRLVADAIQYVADQPVSEAKKYTDLLETGSETNMPSAELEAYITAFMNQSTPIAFTLGTAPYETVQDASGKWGIKLEPDKFQALKQAMETGGDMNQIVAPPELV